MSYDWFWILLSVTVFLGTVKGYLDTAPNPPTQEGSLEPHHLWRRRLHEALDELVVADLSAWPSSFEEIEVRAQRRKFEREEREERRRNSGFRLWSDANW